MELLAHRFEVYGTETDLSAGRFYHFFNFFFNFYFFRTVQHVQIPLNLPGHSFSFLKAELSARRLSSQDQGLAI